MRVLTQSEIDNLLSSLLQNPTILPEQKKTDDIVEKAKSEKNEEKPEKVLTKAKCCDIIYKR